MNRKTILVVDDNPQILRTVGRMVSQFGGVEVITAMNARDARKICGESEATGLYAVISDYDLGFGANGLRVLTSAPIGAIRILMSGDLPIDCRPADHILSKPFRAADLMAALGLERKKEKKTHG